MIRQIVDRCHVSDSNFHVIKYVISRLKRKYKTWKSLSQVERKKMMKEIIKIHKENRSLYNFVMRG